MNCVKKKSASQKRIYIFKTKKLGHVLFVKKKRKEKKESSVICAVITRLS